MELNAPKGTRDFLVPEKRLRDQIVEKAKAVFEQYGFSSIETPTFERYEVLSAKFAAGEESDALRETFQFEDQGGRKLGLRFDLTVPLARVVAQNQQLRYPFKRYQVERVFRDGPVEANRYREFLQCDVDTVGASGMMADAEILALAQALYQSLGIKAVLRVNNRKLLNELLEAFRVPDGARESALIALDKLDKQSAENVEKEMVEKGVPETAAKRFLELARLKGSGSEKEKRLTQILGQSAGLKETKELLSYCRQLGVLVEWDLSLARGLAYYTGPVFEATSAEQLVKGSIGGGGRYDNLIGGFLDGKKIIPATGFSFGIERMFDLLKERKSVVGEAKPSWFVFGIGVRMETLLPLVQQLRSIGLNVSFDLLDRGASKNLDFASKEGFSYCVIVGEDERKKKEISLRDMKTGKQRKVKLSKIALLKKFS